MKLAAIDVGSNAARLLICEASEKRGGQASFTKLNLVRVPLRLGMDVFATGSIGPEKQSQMIGTMQAYQLLMNVYGVSALKACATSAMRDAANGPLLLKRIRKEAGIDLKIISGDEEANTIYETHIAENLSNRKSYLYIDVGGGSTELTLFAKGRMEFKESFNIGTIRLLQGQVGKAAWEEMKSFLKEKVRNCQPLEAIGSGGNINKIFSLSKKKEGQPLKLDLLRSFHKELAPLSVAERMQAFQLRTDRADVIVPALEIYLSVMRWIGATEIYVPKIGLADGLIRILYRELQAGTS